MDFYEELFKLKRVIRRGWQLRDVQGRLESDAEHTCSMMLLALKIMAHNDLKLDQLKVLKMCAYHELGEIDVGDITPVDHISKAEKFEREYAAIERISNTYNMPEILDIWLEFEENETPEAKFVKSLDRYDAVKQAQFYEKYSLAEPGLYQEFHTTSEPAVDYAEGLDLRDMEPTEPVVDNTNDKGDDDSRSL